MLRPSWLVVLPLLGAACVDRPPLDLELTDDVSWFAVVAFVNSKVADASPLLTRGDQVTIDPEASGTSARILGFTSEQIDPLLELGDPSVVERQPLVGAEPCHSALPDPASAWAVENGEARALPSTELEAPVRLTAPWLSESCPQLDLSDLSLLEDDCAPADCQRTLKQEGCNLILEAQCGRPAIEARVQALGGLCVPPIADDESGCVGGGRRSQVQGEISCGSGDDVCSIALHEPPAEPFAPKVDSVRLVESTDYVPAINANDPLPLAAASLGYLYDLLPIEDVVVVSGSSQPATDEFCGSTDLSTLWALDPQTLQTVRTATAPNCLNRLLADPERPDQFVGFHATTLIGASMAVSRFDAQLNQLQTRSLNIPTVLPGTHRVENLLYLDQLGLFAALLIPRSPLGFHIIVFLERDLNVFAAVSLEDLARNDTLAGFVRTGPSRLASATLDGRLVGELDFQDVRETNSVIFASGIGVREFGPGSIVQSLFYDSRHRTLAGAVSGAVPRLFLASTESGMVAEPRIASIYEKQADPTALEIDPSDENQIWVAITEQSAARPTYLSRLDTRARYFKPGLALIGEGPASRMRANQDAVFVALPWSGSVARVEP